MLKELIAKDVPVKVLGFVMSVAIYIKKNLILKVLKKSK